MIREHLPRYVGGRAESEGEPLEVRNKYTGEVIARVPLATREDLERAIDIAVRGAPAMAALTSFERRDILLDCVEGFRRRREELVHVLTLEAGKPVSAARTEVERMIETFSMAAEEAIRIHGEVFPMDVTPRSKGYRGFWKRVPVGPCSFITPFNFPLNLVAHKVAPAIAAGCSFVLKPASLTPLSALLVGEVLAETDLPRWSFSILPCARDAADPLVEDDRLKLLSFTGSAAVGWDLKARAGKKKVVLELGGNAACIVDEDACIEEAVRRIVIGGYSQSGQSCISVQRVLVHRSLVEPFREELVSAVKALIMGDPRDEDTTVGPMISDKEAERVHEWILQARVAGGRILCGGGREGRMVEPTVLEDVPADQPIVRKEAFGPVVVLSTFEDFEEALREVNDSVYGLQAGVFTGSLSRAMTAWDRLEVGGVVVGDIPSFRVDHMPYGGVKDSGLGREGPRQAIEDMTEPRLLIIRDAP